VGAEGRVENHFWGRGPGGGRGDRIETSVNFAKKKKSFITEGALNSTMEKKKTHGSLGAKEERVLIHPEYVDCSLDNDVIKLKKLGSALREDDKLAKRIACENMKS